MHYCLILVLLLATIAHAGEPSPCWQGLTGLYTHPTAETLPPGQLAISFSEIRFPQRGATTQMESVWFGGAVTLAPWEHVEIALVKRNEHARFRPRGGGPLVC